MNRTAKFIAVIAGLLAGVVVRAAQSSSAAPDAASFAPFQQWMAAVLTSDAATLKSLYSTDPPAQIRIKTVMHETSADTDFWLGLKSPSMRVEIVRLVVTDVKASVIFRAVVSSEGQGSVEQSINLTDDQQWQKQGEKWKLVYVERTDAPLLKQPADMKKDLYPADADAHAEIREAEQRAAKQHKRLLLVVGANWCFDCHVLDLAFHSAELAPIVTANYEVIHIDIGLDSTKNADVLKQFDVSLDKGVPVVLIAESDGKVLFNQKNGEFEDARGLSPEYLVDFLNKWKPRAH